MKKKLVCSLFIKNGERLSFKKMNKRLIEFKRKEKYWNEFLKEIDEKYADIQDQREKSRKISWDRAVFINEWLIKLNAQRDLLPYRVLHGLF